jgi:hypothetical protein
MVDWTADSMVGMWDQTTVDLTVAWLVDTLAGSKVDWTVGEMVALKADQTGESMMVEEKAD